MNSAAPSVSSDYVAKLREVATLLRLARRDIRRLLRKGELQTAQACDAALHSPIESNRLLRLINA